MWLCTIQPFCRAKPNAGYTCQKKAVALFGLYRAAGLQGYFYNFRNKDISKVLSCVVNLYFCVALLPYKNKRQYMLTLKVSR